MGDTEVELREVAAPARWGGRRRGGEGTGARQGAPGGGGARWFSSCRAPVDREDGDGGAEATGRETEIFFRGMERGGRGGSYRGDGRC